jgi:acetyl-CoA acyltransferase
MREAVIAGYLRTAQSRSRPTDPGRDWFHQLRGDDLLSMLFPELLKRTGIKSEEIDDCLIGCSLAIGENWAYGGRFSVMLSNLHNSVAAKAIDQQCGSSIAAAQIGAMEIMTGYANVVLIGGMEHMTRVPRGQAWIEGGHAEANKRLVDEEQYAHWDILNAINMGMTAEKLFSLRNFKKEELDQWAKRSHDLAGKAQKEKYFENEIFPIEARQADGSIKIVDTDQSVRESVTLEALANLKPVFKENGVITAGNSSPLNAGASAILLMEKSLAKKRNIKPLATIRSIGFAGVDPTIMGFGPVPATQKALDKVGLTPKDIDYWEINEAFSIVVLNCIRELGLDKETVNIKGGALALGHPLGATGCRLIGTLARILNEKKARYGCANACVGGGQGSATIIERENYDW